MKKFLYLCLVLALTFASKSVLACQFPGAGVFVIAWPTPDSGAKNGQTVVLAPTNTEIWFSLTQTSQNWTFSLQDPEGHEISTDIETFNTHGYSPAPTWVMAKPTKALRPNTTYTVTVDFVGAEETWTFTTNDGVLREEPPKIEGLRYFVVDQYVSGDDCGKLEADRRYAVLVDEPLVRQPFFYELELHFEEGAGEVVSKYISYDWGAGPRPYGSALAETFERNPLQYPCMTLHITDVAGRTVSSEPRCVPDGCLSEYPAIGDLSQDNENALLQVWEDWSTSWNTMSQACRTTPPVEPDPPTPPQDDVNDETEEVDDEQAGAHKPPQTPSETDEPTCGVLGNRNAHPSPWPVALILFIFTSLFYGAKRRPTTR